MMKTFNDTPPIDALVEESLTVLHGKTGEPLEDLRAEFEESYLGWYMQERYRRDDHEYLSLKALGTVMEAYDGTQ